MAKHLTILITGATGYIGGAILTRLLSHPDRKEFRITAIIRDAAKATRLQGFGVEAVVGSHNDRALITPLAAASDVVITAANVDDMEAAEAILDGMRQRKDQTGVAPILIHTSGTAVLGDDAQGMHANAPVYSDLDLPLLDSIPASQPHRKVDLTVLKSDQQDHLRAWIVIPSTIWGRATGPLVDADIMNPKSQQIPRLINISLSRGRAGMVGKGLNLWPNVEISELADLYILIFDQALSSSIFKHGREGLFFGANGEHRLYDVSQAIGDSLVKIGRADKSQPTTLTPDEIITFFGPPPDGIRKANGSYGSNSRARADRGYDLGWKPAKGTQEMLDGIADEVQAVIADGKQ